MKSKTCFLIIEIALIIVLIILRSHLPKHKDDGLEKLCILNLYPVMAFSVGLLRSSCFQLS